MFKILNAVRKLKHTSNIHGNHEKQIERLLVNNCYEKKTIEQLSLEKKLIRSTEYYKSDSTMWYVPQPCGSQSFPDFIVGDKLGNIFYLECKSSKNDHILWNSGMPKPRAIYVFSSGKHNAQTIVMGGDIWSKEELQLQPNIPLEQLTHAENKKLENWLMKHISLIKIKIMEFIIMEDTCITIWDPFMVMIIEQKEKVVFIDLWRLFENVKTFKTYKKIYERSKR